MPKTICSIILSVGVLAAAGNGKYEVWSIDQSNSPGKTFGGTLYIWDGHKLENKHKAKGGSPEKIDLSGAASALCFRKTGANPVRPHMLAINPSETHAIVSFVASGATPGVGIIRVTEGGRNGIFEAVAPMSNVDAGGVQRADGHALSLRRSK